MKLEESGSHNVSVNHAFWLIHDVPGAQCGVPSHSTSQWYQRLVDVALQLSPVHDEAVEPVAVVLVDSGVPQCGKH